jgi:FixJ family two-component response regulator
MMSGQTDAMISKEALSEGANFFMNKPLLPEGMEIVLKTLRSTQTTAA